MTGTSNTASQLQAALDAAVASPDTNFPGAVLYVRGPDFGLWSAAAGLARSKRLRP